MKKLMIAALLAAQANAVAPPARAADLVDTGQRPGAFAGLRVRVPLDAQGEARRVRAGLAVAPALHSRSASGEMRMRLGEGIELGVIGREPVRLRVAGQDVRRLGAAQQDGAQQEETRRRGPSTVAWVAIGLAAAVVVTAAVGAIWLAARVDDD